MNIGIFFINQFNVLKNRWSIMAIGFLIIFVLLNNIKSNYYEDKNSLGRSERIISFKLRK